MHSESRLAARGQSLVKYLFCFSIFRIGGHVALQNLVSYQLPLLQEVAIKFFHAQVVFSFFICKVFRRRKGERTNELMMKPKVNGRSRHRVFFWGGGENLRVFFGGGGEVKKKWGPG